ncbi:MAG: hypothetical protein M3Y07_01455 [Acidobacteriota bacterium]|nr:hypothetical protein [Acidobacteriota bacterium]
MTDDGKAVSAMGADFRDYDNDGPGYRIQGDCGRNVPALPQPGQRPVPRRDLYLPHGAAFRALGREEIAIADFDNDGWKDGDRYKLKSTVFLNSGRGGFIAGPEFDGPYRGGVIADFDRDGPISSSAR